MFYTFVNITHILKDKQILYNWYIIFFYEIYNFLAKFFFSEIQEIL